MPPRTADDPAEPADPTRAPTPGPIRRRTLLAGLAGLTLTACTASTGTDGPTPAPSSSTGSPTPASSPTPSTGGATPDARVTRTLLTGLDTPWGLTFLPDRSAVLGSRDRATLTGVRLDGRTTDLGVVDGVEAYGEGGLLGLAASPTFATDRLLYLYYSASSDNRVVRARLGTDGIGAQSVVVQGIPRADHHNGGGLTFGPDGLLYISTGEAGEPDLAPDKDSLGGKILRVRPDGTAAPGNPFGSRVFSYGHRNVESIAFSGSQLWAVEFGDSDLDELNPIVAGGNYGWPATQGRTDAAGIVSPAAQWPTDDAGPAGLAIRGGVAWIACVTGRRLYRTALDGRVAAEPTAFFVGEYGRLRHVVAAPDGTLWMTTSNTDGRATPAADDDRILALDVR